MAIRSNTKETLAESVQKAADWQKQVQAEAKKAKAEKAKAEKAKKAK